MREILFRGKRVDGYGWIYGGLIYDEAEHNQPRIVIGREYSTGTFFNAQAPRVGYTTVGQYTGLTDKNGKKIFEGDIVKVHWIYFNSGEEEDMFYEVIWHKAWNGWGLKNLKHTQCCYLDLVSKGGKVIGNIHDNPELLEVEEC